MQPRHLYQYMFLPPPDDAANQLLPDPVYSPTVHIGHSTLMPTGTPIQTVLCRGYLWANEPASWVGTGMPPTEPPPGPLCPLCAEHWRAVRQPASAAVGELTAQEIEALRLMADGASNPEIAQALSVSAATASGRVASIIRKLGVANRTQAVMKAIQLHLL